MKKITVEVPDEFGEKACEAYSLRLESMVKAWIPKKTKSCWYWDFEYGGATKATFGFSEYYMTDAIIGSTHKTKEKCEAWGKKYAKAFNYSKK